MKRFAFLLIIALLTIFIIIWLKRPDIIDDISLWGLGIAGGAIAFLKGNSDKIDKTLKSIIGHRSLNTVKNTISNQKDTNTITLLRYTNDNYTTLGLLFINGRFFSYSLENHSKNNLLRIPAGTYPIEGVQTTNKDLFINYRPENTSFYIGKKNIQDNNDKYILLTRNLCTANPDDLKKESESTFSLFYSKITDLISRNISANVNIIDEELFNEIISQ